MSIGAMSGSLTFTLIIPVLVWRSFSSRHVDEEE
ncbi:branched-chain amino acid ABC transporter permease [Bordetella pertussis]|nr:branched-chain amino acid ABC transporter permease [Bordetella pertussis]